MGTNPYTLIIVFDGRCICSILIQVLHIGNCLSYIHYINLKSWFVSLCRRCVLYIDSHSSVDSYRFQCRFPFQANYYRTRPYCTRKQEKITSYLLRMSYVMTFTEEQRNSTHNETGQVRKFV